MTSPNYATSAGLKRLGNIPLCGGSSRVSLCNVKLTAQTRILYMSLSLHITARTRLKAFGQRTENITNQ